MPRGITRSGPGTTPSLVASLLAERVLALKGVTDIEDYYQALPWGGPLIRHRGGCRSREWVSAKIDLETVAAGFRNDDSRLRSTRGRTLTE